MVSGNDSQGSILNWGSFAQFGNPCNSRLLKSRQTLLLSWLFMGWLFVPTRFTPPVRILTAFLCMWLFMGIPYSGNCPPSF